MAGPHGSSRLTRDSDSLLSSVLFASAILAAACGFVLPGTWRAQAQEKAQASTQSRAQASAQVPAKPAEQKPEVSESTTELKTQDTKRALKVRVNHVIVRVVIRDDKGRAVGTLHEEDFQLFDNKKPQIISHFAVETPATQLAKVVKPDNVAGHDGAPESGAALTMPQRYVGYLFDDVHLAFEDLARARDAADRQITAAGQTGDRAGIYTTSGQTTLDFTDDRTKLHETLAKLRPHPVGRSCVRERPNGRCYRGGML